MNHVELVEQYAAWMRSWHASDRTVRERSILATGRLQAWGLEGFTQRNVEQFLARPTLSRWSAATYHAHLTSLCDWLHAAGHLPTNPMLEVRKARPPKGTPRPLSEGDVTRVLAAASGHVRDWVQIALLSGLRASEVAKVRGEDVHPDGIYVEGKGGTREVLPCHPDLWAMAQRYPRSGYWFPGPENGHVRAQKVSLEVGRLFKTLGIEGSIHRCRHTYGTRLMRAGVNVRTVQKLMRHANLSTTANYTAVDEDEMRAAILRLSA